MAPLDEVIPESGYSSANMLRERLAQRQEEKEEGGGDGSGLVWGVTVRLRFCCILRLRFCSAYRDYFIKSMSIL